MAVVSILVNFCSLYFRNPAIPIIPALSVVYSNFGIKVFHPNLVSVSFKTFLISELALTPPAIAIFFMPVCFTAFFNLSIRI